MLAKHALMPSTAGDFRPPALAHIYWLEWHAPLSASGHAHAAACPSCESSLKLAGATLGRERKQHIRVMDITEVVGEAI
jgi:hypothetical protein